MLSKNCLWGTLSVLRGKCCKFQDIFLSGNHTDMAYAVGKINFLS